MLFLPEGHTSSIQSTSCMISDHFGVDSHTKWIMSRVEAFRDTNLRSMLRGLRTDIAMAVDDPFPLVYGLVDTNIITDQLLKVSTTLF